MRVPRIRARIRLMIARRQMPLYMSRSSGLPLRFQSMITTALVVEDSHSISPGVCHIFFTSMKIARLTSDGAEDHSNSHFVPLLQHCSS